MALCLVVEFHHQGECCRGIAVDAMGYSKDEILRGVCGDGVVEREEVWPLCFEHTEEFFI